MLFFVLLFFVFLQREYEDQISEHALELCPADLISTNNETEKELQKTVSSQSGITGT